MYIKYMKIILHLIWKVYGTNSFCRIIKFILRQGKTLPINLNLLLLPFHKKENQVQLQFHIGQNCILISLNKHAIEGSWFSTLVMDGDFLNKEKSFFNLFLFFYFTSNFFLDFLLQMLFSFILHLTLFTSHKIKIGKRENRITFYISTSFVFRLTFFFVIYIFLLQRKYFGIHEPILPCYCSIYWPGYFSHLASVVRKDIYIPNVFFQLFYFLLQFSKYEV